MTGDCGYCYAVLRSATQCYAGTIGPTVEPTEDQRPPGAHPASYFRDLTLHGWRSTDFMSSNSSLFRPPEPIFHNTFQVYYSFFTACVRQSPDGFLTSGPLKGRRTCNSVLKSGEVIMSFLGVPSLLVGIIIRIFRKAKKRLFLYVFKL